MPFLSKVTMETARVILLEIHFWDFPGGAVVKNPPSNAGDTGSVPGQGTGSHMAHGMAKYE